MLYYPSFKKTTAACISGFRYFGISTTAGGGDLGRLRSSTLSPSSSTPRRSRGVLELGRGVLELKLHEEESKYTKA